jgi:replicative DNA helicase
MSRDAQLFDLDAECAVLGACLLDGANTGGAYALASRIVRVERKVLKNHGGLVEYAGDFGDSRHNVIFGCMGALVERGEAIDVRTLADELRRSKGGDFGGELNSVGGAQYLDELSCTVSSPAQVEAHARIVRRFADARRVDEALARARRAVRSSLDPDTALARTMEVIRKGVEGGSVRGGPKPIVEHCEEAWSEIESAMRGDSTPVRFGIPSLDKIVGGMFAGQIITLAGVQGRGKTAFLAQVLRHNALRFKAHAEERNEAPKRVAWWSLEMPGTELMFRHAAWDGAINPATFRDGGFTQDQLNTVAGVFNDWSSLPVDLDGSGGVSALDVRAWLHAHPEVRLAAIDWIGHLQPPPDCPRDAKKHEVVERNYAILRDTALQLKIPILVLNQFTQEANRSGDLHMHDMLGGQGKDFFFRNRG